MLATVGNLPGYKEKLVVIACYIPPNYNVPRGRAAISYIEDTILEVKQRYSDPFIVVACDFNQWPLEQALDDLPDMREADVAPTRKDHYIDRMATNFNRMVEASGTVPLLEVEPRMQGTESDHRVAYVQANLPRIKTCRWETYSYRYQNPESVEEFGRWLAGFDWAELTSVVGSNPKAEFYQETVTSAMERFFPLLTVHRKSSDCPWTVSYTHLTLPTTPYV